MKKNSKVPDSTAIRVALWRALHIKYDALPYVLEDDIGFKLVQPEAGWEQRPDMHVQGTAPFRASIVARARFIEDSFKQQVENGINQYVMLGSGLDTFAQRNSSLMKKINLFEVDQLETLNWKKQRLLDLEFEIPPSLHFVPIDFEKSETWLSTLVAEGFNINKPAFVTFIGVSMYLTIEAIEKTLLLMKELASGSVFIMTFMLPLNLVNEEDRIGYERSLKGAQASGTPFISFFSPSEMIAFSSRLGFSNIQHCSSLDMIPKYFKNRTDNLRPSSGEEFLILTI